MKSSQQSSAIRNSIRQSLETEISRIGTRLRYLERDRRHLEQNPNDLVFEVTLTSRWAREGESSVTARSGRGLSEALKRAQEKFKKINKRSDIQADYSARAFITRDVRTKSKLFITIDERFLADLASTNKSD